MKTMLTLFAILFSIIITAAGQDTFDNFPNAKLPHEFNKINGIEIKAQHSFKKKEDKMQGVIQLIDSVLDLWEGGKGELSTYKYDKNGNIFQWLIEYKDSLQWIFKGRHTYSYDSVNNLLTDLCQKWNNGYWEDSTRVTNEFNQKGLIYYSYYEYWENGNWNDDGSSIYSYDSRDNISRRLYGKNGIEQIVTDYDYNEKNLLEKLSTRYSMLSIWEIRYTYTYNDNGKLINLLYESNYGDGFKKRNRTSYLYNSDGVILSYLTENYKDSTSWDLSQKFTYNYDIKGNFIKGLTEEYKDDKWINKYQVNYTYNQFDNLIMVENYEWIDNKWIENNDSYLYTTNTNSKSVAYGRFWGYKIIFNWSSFTSVNKNIDNTDNYTIIYPNPASDNLYISYISEENSFADISIKNIFGNNAINLLNLPLDRGNNKFNIDISRLTSGIYFCNMKINNHSVMKKFIVVK